MEYYYLLYKEFLLEIKLLFYMLISGILLAVGTIAFFTLPPAGVVILGKVAFAAGKKGT